jgi:predicted regulator of Ras-like GTPase activity (Roadblock/LC7/MglB family)
MRIAMPRAEMHAEVTTVSSVGLEGLEAELDQILQGFRRRIKGVRGSVVADSNGLTVASDIRGGVSPAVLAAMSTLIAQSAGSVFENIAVQGPDSILMEGPQLNVVVKHVPLADVTVLALVEKTTNLGALKIELDRAAEGIAGALGFSIRPARAAVSELFILTTSGILLRHYSDTLRTDLDRDALAGMLVAVRQFVQQTLASKAGDLTQLRYGAHSIYFFQAAHIVAAVVAKDGNAESLRYHVLDALQDFEDRHGKTLASWDGDVDAFPGIDDCFEKVIRG